MANVRTDRFGNATVLKAAKSVVDRKTGSVLPIFRGFIEITSGGLYKFEVSNMKRESKDGNPALWVKFTKVPNRQGQGGFGGGQQRQQRF